MPDLAIKPPDPTSAHSYPPANPVEIPERAKGFKAARCHSITQVILLGLRLLHGSWCVQRLEWPRCRWAGRLYDECQLDAALYAAFAFAGFFAGPVDPKLNTFTMSLVLTPESIQSIIS